MFSELFSNKFLLVTLMGWFFAQLLKGIIHSIVYKEFSIKRFFGDGGMPSGHASTVAALTAYVGIEQGFNSLYFAMCLVLMIVVCRDAVGVRLETGKQAIIINDMRDVFAKLGHGEIDETKLKEFVGHTPLQIVVGIILGVLIAVVMALLT